MDKIIEAYDHEAFYLQLIPLINTDLTSHHVTESCIDT